MLDASRRKLLQVLGAGAAVAAAGCNSQAPASAETEADQSTPTSTAAAKQTDVDRIAADPADIPDPIDRSSSTTHDVTLEVEEHTAELEPGVTFDFMTFGGQVPGPMIRVRQGDTVHLTVDNLSENNLQHNVDLHAVYGTGGGNVATTANPGSGNDMTFQAKYPGAFIYHCAVPNLDQHISAGMFGMILVEPKDGLPEVDREFYLGQHEVYTDKDTGAEGHHNFDMNGMAAEEPSYVLFNGGKAAITPDGHGGLSAKQDERVRVFLVVGGPNYSSNFHPIGNIWSRAYRDGGLPMDGDFEAVADRNIQTMKVPPGSCMIGEMDTPVPERIKLVDHALSRVVRKGCIATIDVEGEKRPEIFDPSPDMAASEDEEGPLY
jgi:nitrite reductase (NO-forming)